MNGGRVGAEIRRELTRTTGPRALLVAVALASLFGLLVLAGLSVDAFVSATYLFLPMLACPLAAQRVASDRERGVTKTLATTPLRPAEFLLAKLAALATVVVAGLVSSLPLLYVLTEPAAPGAFASTLPIVVQGLAVGLVALVVGLLVGYAKGGPATGSVAIGFGAVIVWSVLGFQHRLILSWADGATEQALLQALARASPVTWALQTHPPHSVGVVAGHETLLVGLGALLSGLLVVLAAVATGLQHLDGWFQRPLGHPVAVGLLAVGLAGAGATLVAFDAPSHPDPGALDEASRAQAGELHLDLGDVEVENPWHRETPLTVDLSIRGPPNATVRITQLALSGSNLSIRHQLDTPRRVTLDEVHEGRGTFAPRNETYGVGRLEVEAVATPHRIARLWSIRADLQVDGNETTLATNVPAFEWHTSTQPVLAAGAVPLTLTAGIAVVLPGRLNRW